MQMDQLPPQQPHPSPVIPDIQPDLQQPFVLQVPPQQQVVNPVQPIVTPVHPIQPGQVPPFTWSYFNPEFAGKPDEDV